MIPEVAVPGSIDDINLRTQKALLLNREKRYYCKETTDHDMQSLLGGGRGYLFPCLIRGRERGR